MSSKSDHVDKPKPKRACDACAHRRVRCDAELPRCKRKCENCTKRNLACTYNREQKKKGPSGKRLGLLKADGPVPSTSAGFQYQINPAAHASLFPMAGPSNVHSAPGFDLNDFLSSLFTSAPAPQLTLHDSLPLLQNDHFLYDTNQDMSSPLMPSPPAIDVPQPSSSRLLPSALPTQFSDLVSFVPNNDFSEPNWSSEGELSPGSYTASMPVEDDLPSAVDIFFDKLDPLLSIFNKSQLKDKIDSGAYLTDPVLYSMLLTMKAITMVQPQHGWNPGMDLASMSISDHEIPSAVLRRAQAIRSSVDVGENPSIEAVMGAFMMFACNFQLNKWGQAWVNLQEAISVGQLLRIEDIRSYNGLPIEEQERRLKMYWLLAVTERAFALQGNHEVHFKGSITRLDSHLAFFWENSQRIVSAERSDYLRRRLFLFDHIDEKILSCYNGQCTPASCVVFTPNRALTIYQALSDPALHANPNQMQELPHDNHSSIQASDLWITARWLQDKIFNLSLSHGFVKEGAQEDVFRPITPFHITQAALGTCRLLPIQSLEACGISMVEKLYHMVVTVCRVSAIWPHLRSQNQLAEIVHSALALFTLFRNGRHVFLDKLKAEVAGVGISS